MKLRFIIYFLIGTIIILIPYIPHIYWYLKTPPSHTYTFLHQYPLDFYLYLSSINQGKNGEWLLYPAFTTETNLASGLFYVYFIAVGKLAAIFYMWLPVAYHAAKIASEFLYLIFLYKLAEKILGKQLAVWAAIVSLIWTIPPESYMGSQIWFPFPPWWFSYHPFERMDNLPHHFFGTTILVASLLSFLTYIESKTFRHLLLTIVLVIVHSIAFPPTTVFYLFSVPLAFLFTTIRNTVQKKSFVIDKKYVLIIFLTVIAAAVCIGIIKWQETFGFPWNQWTPWELGRWNRGEPEFNTALVKVFGVLPAFLVLLLPLAWKKGNFHFFILIAWGAIPYILLPFADFLTVPKIRIVQLIPTVPMTFAAIVVMYTLFGTILRGKIFVAMLVTLIGINVWLSIGQYKAKWHYQFSEGRYFKNTTLDALAYIDTHVPRKTHILSYEYDGIVIPVFSQAIPYWAQLNQTYDFFRKKEEVTAFLTHQMSDVDALAFLKKNDIRYVYYGPHEKNISGGSLPYSFLHEEYQNTDVTLYSVTFVY